MNMLKLLTSTFAQSARSSVRNLSVTSAVNQQSRNLPESDDSRKRRAVSFNQIQLIGGVVERPRLRVTVNGVEYAVFDVITNYSRKMKDGSFYNESLRHNVQAFGNLGKIVIDRVDKGSRVYVMGRLRPSSFKLEDGRTFPTSTVVADVLQKISSARDERLHEDFSHSDESDSLEIPDDHEIPPKSK